MLWFFLLIPVVTGVVLYAWFSHEMTLWEFTIPFVATLALITASKTIIEGVQTRDTEFWSGMITKAEYYEDWNETVPCTHSYEICTGTGKSESCTTHYRHPYDVDEHPPRWEVHDTNGLSLNVSEAVYEKLRLKFGNEHFVDLGRNYHTHDGDKYVTKWPETRETAEPMTTKHTYENRVKPSRSVFDYPEVTDKQVAKYGLYEYPKIRDHYKQDFLLGANNPEIEKQLRYVNAKLGPRRQAQIFVLLFRDQPREAGELQEAYWVGSNKNEFAVAIGLDDQNNVQWAHPFSWTKKERLKIDARHFVEDQGTLDLQVLVDFLYHELKNRFDRREFSEFDYLSVKPPIWAVLLVFVLSVLANVGIGWFVVANEYKS